MSGDGNVGSDCMEEVAGYGIVGGECRVDNGSMTGCGSKVVGNNTVGPDGDCRVDRLWQYSGWNNTVGPDGDCRVINGNMTGCGSKDVGKNIVGPDGDCRVDNGRLLQYSGW